MDKELAHQVARASGVEVPRSVVFRAGEDFVLLRQRTAALSWPLFVKPCRAGSSFGVTRVTAQPNSSPPFQPRWSETTKWSLRRKSQDLKVGCAVLGDRDLTLGRPDEIELQKGFFTYDEKYHLITARIHTPARISPSQEQAVQALSSKLYRALDCRGMARVDLFLTPDGRLIFNEINTIPALRRTAAIPP